MLNFENELNPEAVASNEGADVDTVEAAIAAYEAMGDVEMAMIKVDMLEKGAKILTDSISANDALVAKGYESEGGASPVVSGYEAVCVMLGVNANTMAGYESDDDKKAEGLLSKIWTGIRKAADAVWKFIKDMFNKVSTFIKGLFGKKQTAADKIDTLLNNGETPVERDLTPAEGETVAEDLSVFAMWDESINGKTVANFIKFQKEMIDSLSNTDMVKDIKNIKGDIEFLKDGAGKNDLSTIVDKAFKTINELKPKNASSFTDLKLNKEYVNKAEDVVDEIKESNKSLKFVNSNMYLTAITSKHVKVLIVVKFSDKADSKEITNVYKEITLSADSEDIKKWAKKQRIKSLKVGDIKSLRDVLKTANESIVSAMKRIDVDKITNEAKDLIKTSEDTLKGFNKGKKDDDKLDRKGYDKISKKISICTKIVDNYFPKIIAGVAETGSDSARSKVVEYVKKSYTKTLED